MLHTNTERAVLIVLFYCIYEGLRTPTGGRGRWFDDPLDEESAEVFDIGIALGNVIALFLIKRGLHQVYDGQETDDWFLFM